MPPGRKPPKSYTPSSCPFHAMLCPSNVGIGSPTWRLRLPSDLGTAHEATCHGHCWIRRLVTTRTYRARASSWCEALPLDKRVHFDTELMCRTQVCALQPKGHLPPLTTPRPASIISVMQENVLFNSVCGYFVLRISNKMFSLFKSVFRLSASSQENQTPKDATGKVKGKQQISYAQQNNLFMILRHVMYNITILIEKPPVCPGWCWLVCT